MNRRFLLIAFILILQFSGSVLAQNESSELLEWIRVKQNAHKTNDTATIIKSCKYLGDGYAELGKVEKSNQYLLEGLEWAINAKDFRNIGIINNLLANNASYAGYRSKAFDYYNNALQAFTKIGNLPKMAMIQMNIGTEYASIGDYPKAIAWELKALKTKEASGELDNLGYFYQKVGELFKDTDVDKWDEYVKKAYALTRKPDAVGPSTRVAIFNDFGGIAQKRKRYREAHAWYDSMYVLSKTLEYDLGMATALSNRSLVLKDEKKLEEALFFIIQSLKISGESGRSYSILVDNTHAASILLDLNRPEEARKYCQVALTLAQEKKTYPEQLADAQRLMAKIEEASGNWRAAYLNLQGHHEAMDSIRNAAIAKNIMELEVKYQTAEKEKQIVKLDNENILKSLRITRIKWMVLVLILILFLSVSVLVFWSRKNRLNHLRQQAELKQKLLRSQMNPHFIFNTLNAINLFIQTNQGLVASDYLARYAKLMRQILENSAMEYVSLKNEVAFIHNYLVLQQLRFKDVFEYEVILDESLDIEFLEVPPMIAQPFVENAIEHGFREMKSGGKLVVEFQLINNRLMLIVTDNGSGFMIKEEKRRSFAMAITSERLSVLGEKSDALTVESPVENSEKGTRVTICIPFKLV